MVNKFTLKQRILLGYSVPILLAMGVAGAVQYNVNTVDKASKEVKTLQSTITEINEVVFAIGTIVRNARGHALFPTDHSYDKSYQEGKELFAKASVELDKIIQSSQQDELFNKLRKEGQEIDRNTQTVFELIHQGKIPEAVTLTKSLRMSEVNQLREEMLKQVNNDLNTYSKQQQAAVYWLNMAVWLGAAVSGILAIGIGIILASRISETINETVTKITESSSAIAITTQQQERIATLQASAVNQTTTTMDELGASSRQAAEQAESVVENARQVLLLAEEGSKGAHQVLNLAEQGAAGARQVLNLTEAGTKVVGQTLEGMSELREKVGAITEQIMHLNEQASQIGNITNVVTDLANQTNMLALNAAVEAVRAGESGKGFSVVAGEIRRLADQSKKSAEKINTLIIDIQKAMNSTVIVTDEGTKTVRESIKFSNETAAAFQGVAQAINDIVLKNQTMTLTAINDIILQNQKTSLAAINEIVLKNQQIAFNSKQQAVAIQQVVEAMNSINVGARETASGISQTKVGTQQLNEAALNLKEII